MLDFDHHLDSDPDTTWSCPCGENYAVQAECVDCGGCSVCCTCPVVRLDDDDLDETLGDLYGPAPSRDVDDGLDADSWWAA